MAWLGRFSDFAGSCIDQKKYTYSDEKLYPPNNTLHLQDTSSGHITKIEDVYVGASNANIVGVILSKESPKSILSRKNPGSERYLLNFIIRDSPAYFASVTCWGNELFVKDLASIFHIGDTVQVSNVQVQPKSPDGNEDRYRPWTPVPFHFVISENHSNVSLYCGSDRELDNYRSLLQVPTKANNDFYTLEDVLANGQNIHGEHINLLAVIKRIGQAKELTTKNGKQTKRCELKLMDETCSSFALVLWDEEVIDRALTWTPLETVVFIADVRVSYDDFRKTMVATSDSKTIITVNPDTLEAHSLYQFAHSETITMETDPEDDFKSNPSLDTITDIFTVEDIKKVQQEVAMENKSTQYGKAYVFVTQFDIDTEEFSHILRYRCEKCRQIVLEDKGYMCMNPDCTQGDLCLFDSSPDMSRCTTEYSISLSMSDHTGTITQCHLDDTAAQQILGVKAEEFKNLGIERKTNIKWTYLLERCKVYFKLFRFSGDTGRTSLRILSCSIPTSQEVIDGHLQEDFLKTSKEITEGHV